MSRQFAAVDAVRDRVPILVGLTGASGSGKTFSALRLATGIQKIVGGDIYGVDTEARRMLHYADRFKFKHVPFEAPFGSRDYLEVLRWCVGQGAQTIIIDSASHEHSGEGGYLDFHGREVERMAGNDAAKAERVKMAAWIRPSQARQDLINGMLRLNANFIFCFRAKEKTKPVKGGGVQELGFMPIAGDEFIFEMTLNALLMPAAGGVPTWNPQQVGERLMVKNAEQFRDLFATSRPFDEATGEALARWALGDAAPLAGALPPSAPAGPREEGVPPGSSSRASDFDAVETLADLERQLEEVAAANLADLWRAQQERLFRLREAMPDAYQKLVDLKERRKGELARFEAEGARG